MGIQEADNKKDTRSLYICTYEQKGDYGRHDIRAIRLGDILSKSEFFNKFELLRQLASIEGEDVPFLMGCCLVGSQILLAGGLKPPPPESMLLRRFGPYSSTKVYLYETDDEEKIEENVYSHGDVYRFGPLRFGSYPPLTPHTHGHRGEGKIIKGDCCYGQLNQGKPTPLVVHVGGKLYVLSGGMYTSARSPVFEEFNSDYGTWTTLPDPPYIDQPYAQAFHYFAYAIVGTKILVSAATSPVYCFDVAAPHPRKWSMCFPQCFPFKGRALVLDLEEEEDNCNKIMFAYERIPGHFCDVSAYSIFINAAGNSNCYLQRIQFLNLLTNFSGLLGRFQSYHFVHLGGRKVCFVVAGFNPCLDVSDLNPNPEKENMKLLVLTFEFSISKDDNSALSISAKTLSSCCFPFDWASETLDAQLLGCFVR